MLKTPRKLLVSSAVAGAAVVAMAGVAFAQGQGGKPVNPPTFAFEKCYGVAAAGKNDCAFGGSTCGGTARADRLGAAWIYTPQGSCAKISGGSAQPKA